MLTDTGLRHLKPKENLYKVNDRDGLYIAVTQAGTISFRYNYSINGRQETVTLGAMVLEGLRLRKRANGSTKLKRWLPVDDLQRGKKPGIKRVSKMRVWAEKWLRGYQMAESTRDMQRLVYQRELKSKFAQQKLSEITHEDLRALTDNIVERRGTGDCRSR